METFAWSQTPTSNRQSVALRTPRLDWSEPHYSLDLHSTPHTSFQALCDSSRFAATHGCRVTLFHPANLHKLPNSLTIVLLNCSID
uniref:Uncharacterized protein n=1 Tax=Oryza barthii TaxID=65489 RepID=A0A0D3HLD9_9ORYZ